MQIAFKSLSKVKELDFVLKMQLHIVSCVLSHGVQFGSVSSGFSVLFTSASWQTVSVSSVGICVSSE